MPKTNVKFEQVRIAKDVKPLLKKACKANLRSAPAEVNHVLRRAYRKPDATITFVPWTPEQKKAIDEILKRK